MSKVSQKAGIPGPGKPWNRDIKATSTRLAMIVEMWCLCGNRPPAKPSRNIAECIERHQSKQSQPPLLSCSPEFECGVAAWLRDVGRRYCIAVDKLRERTVFERKR
jgi:hypothetical protein